MAIRYVIVYTWPDGKIRYQAENRLCVNRDDALVVTMIDARAYLNKARDARLIWDIRAHKERA